MSPRQRTIIRWTALVLLPIAYVVGSEVYFARTISPRGISTARDFFGRFGEPRRIRMVQRDGRSYYEFTGRPPAGFVLATPSAPPAYIFNTNGQFVAWCADPGDTPGFRSTWQLQSTNQVEVGAVRERFGLR
jgi:hypothetical protein